ncbi:hypothetical protein BKI52_32570 [marine bacterium AO1-C]|nr:hypothetical protein BKI52_32570 [marine bacterium AO1-C]
MDSPKNTITSAQVRRWYLLVNLPLIAISLYVHSLLVSAGHVPGNNILENTGLWLLIAFKIVGANAILAAIFSTFKITKS